MHKMPYTPPLSNRINLQDEQLICYSQQGGNTYSITNISHTVSDDWGDSNERQTSGNIWESD